MALRGRSGIFKESKESLKVLRLKVNGSLAGDLITIFQKFKCLLIGRVLI